MIQLSSSTDSNVSSIRTSLHQSVKKTSILVLHKM